MPKKESWKDASGLRKEMKIRKLLLGSQKHDREKCRCEGCYWWAITRTVYKEGKLFFVIPSWKDLNRDEYLRIITSTIRYKRSKKLSKKELLKYLIKRGAPEKDAEQIAESLLRPIHMIMYGKAASPLGILRDI